MTIELSNETTKCGKLMTRDGRSYMRHELTKMSGQKHRFTGMFVRYGLRKAGEDQIKTLCIGNLCIRGKFIAHHVWFDVNEDWTELMLEYGDVISFYAQVAPYIKNYVHTNGETVTDYKLINEENIYLVRKRDERMRDAEERHRKSREAKRAAKLALKGTTIR